MSFLFGRPRVSPLQAAADHVHDGLVEQIRQPTFYLDFNVPDTFEGRFDLLVLHVTLVIRRLRELGPEGQTIAQQLVDTMFRRLDVALRELGVSDVAVPKRMKRLAEAFKGRTTAYDQCLAAENESALVEAVARNVLGGASDGAALTRYVKAAQARLETASLDALRTQAVPFPDPATFVGMPG